MNNIFENAFLRKAYKTRDGRKAVFYNHHNGFARERANYVTMILEGQESIYRWYYDGTAHDKQEHLDIVSEWKETISEEELDSLANDCQIETTCLLGNTQYRALTENEKKIFKAGCRKIMELIDNKK